MQPIASTAMLDAADGKRTTVTLELAIPTRELLMAAPMWQHTTLADAALHLSEEEPNKGVAVLLGSALDAAVRADGDQVILAVAAAVVLLQRVAISQLGGVTE